MVSRTSVSVSMTAETNLSFVCADVGCQQREVVKLCGIDLVVGPRWDGWDANDRCLVAAEDRCNMQLTRDGRRKGRQERTPAPDLVTDQSDLHGKNRKPKLGVELIEILWTEGGKGGMIGAAYSGKKRSGKHGGELSRHPATVASAGALPAKSPTKYR